MKFTNCFKRPYNTRSDSEDNRPAASRIFYLGSLASVWAAIGQYKYTAGLYFIISTLKQYSNNTFSHVLIF
jgi:hypothetical protein